MTAHRDTEPQVSPPARIVQAGEPRSARIESLRAIVALGVLVFHAFGSYALAPGQATFLRRLIETGGQGVYVFFALTGYLLFWPFVRRAAGAQTRVDLARYARNRFLRIVPLYYFIVAFLLITQHGGGSAGQWLHFLTFTQNFSHTTVNTVDGPMWSLGVEVDFYLLLPVLVAALALIARRSQARLALCLVALALASFVVSLVKVQSVTHPDLLWSLSLPTTFFYFVSGMLLAILRWRWQEHPPSALEGPLGNANLWLLAAAVVWLPAVASLRAGVITVPVASFLLVGACVLPLRAGQGLHALEWRPLAILGTASYGIYLWNFPVVDRLFRHGWPLGSFRLVAVSAVICCGVALVTYYLIEAPFLRLRRNWYRPPRERPATAEGQTPAEA